MCIMEEWMIHTVYRMVAVDPVVNQWQGEDGGYVSMPATMIHMYHGRRMDETIGYSRAIE